MSSPLGFWKTEDSLRSGSEVGRGPRAWEPDRRGSERPGALPDEPPVVRSIDFYARDPEARQKAAQTISEGVGTTRTTRGTAIPHRRQSAPGQEQRTASTQPRRPARVPGTTPGRSGAGSRLLSSIGRRRRAPVPEPATKKEEAISLVSFAISRGSTPRNRGEDGRGLKSAGPPSIPPSMVTKPCPGRITDGPAGPILPQPRLPRTRAARARKPPRSQPQGAALPLYHL